MAGGGRRIEVIDCTLRDGEQTPGVWFTVEEKLRLARQLDQAGVDMLDAGFPASSDSDLDAMQQMKSMRLRCRIAATARPLKADVVAAEKARADEVFLFMPTSDLRLEETLGISRERAHSVFRQGAEEAAGRGMGVNLVFEDATRADPDLLVDIIGAVSGVVPVRRAILADTVGCALPGSMGDLVANVLERIADDVVVCTHCHNDFGLATANTLAAVSSGAGAVTCTVNGLGERAGNADLAETVAALTHLMGMEHGVDGMQLRELGQEVERLSGVHCSPTKPVTGFNVFRHESGVHVDGMLKDSRSYEFLPSSWVGQQPEYVLGKHSGRSLIRHLLQEMGVPATSEEEAALLREMKQRAEGRDKSDHARAWTRKEAFHAECLSGIDPMAALSEHVEKRRTQPPPADDEPGPPNRLEHRVMASTLCEKIIDAHTLDAADGLFRRVQIDALLGHDATIALLVDQFEERKLSVWDPEKVLFTNDHFSPPATIERANISRKFIAFGRKLRLPQLMLDRGICHQLLVESHLCQPGSLIVGADSHTIMGGGLGACATGMGSTDILFALATGTTWMRTPETIRIVFSGALRECCSGRDVILELLRRFGEGGARYTALEFHDACEPKLSQDDRFAIANMAIELGAKFGVFVPDEVTAAYCEARDGASPVLTGPDPDAHYADTVEIDLGALSPRVAKPWSPSNVVGIDEIAETDLTMAFLGSCSSGRIQDLRDAAEELEGKRVHESVRMVVIPASVAVYQQAMEAGYAQTLMAAGAILSHSSCGPCGGIDKGVLAADDVCVSTSNRNFRGRMGHWDSQTFLASARTVARAAIDGRLHPGLY